MIHQRKATIENNNFLTFLYYYKIQRRLLSYYYFFTLDNSDFNTKYFNKDHKLYLNQTYVKADHYKILSDGKQ